ncbi:hypothetical protein CN692_06850 [Bacillus sp. AFS002410]|nr:hypothetical protein CN692_06850 [Bacillus sp. AFS002410]
MRFFIAHYFILKKLIGTKGCSTPMGNAGRLRPRRRAEEAQVSPHGKRESCSGNQPHKTFLTLNYRKVLLNR